jgi:recombination protein RecA
MAKKKEQIVADSLGGLLEQIEKAHGTGALIQGTKVTPCDVIPTGSLTLDVALGIGGIPRGRITEIYGPEASGKTTLTLSLAANVQAGGGTVAFIDVEHALDPIYAENIGVNVDKLLISQPDSAEQALEIVDTLCRSKLVDLVIVDSVAALVPKAELEGEMGAAHVGLQARILSQALRKLKGVVNNSNTSLVFINQLREKIGVMFGSPETTSGGRALKFYSSVRIDIRRIATVKGSDGIGTANTVRTKIVKNKLAPPFRQATFDIVFGKGIHKAGCVLDLGVERKIIDKKGSHFSYGSIKLGNGKANACDILEENPQLMDEIREKIFDVPTTNEDEDAGFDGGENTLEDL